MLDRLEAQDPAEPVEEAYPEAPSDRDRWILRRRSERHSADAFRPSGFHVELECSASGEAVPVATVFLTNRECPWRCVMCDLWRHTLPDSVPPGAIPAQIDYALNQLRSSGPARHLKLYNSGSFFDPGAIPRADYPDIAERACGYERVIVECHPALVGAPIVTFRNLLLDYAARRTNRGSSPPQLEVALGLETAHPQVLEKLNKRMTLDRFARSAEFLHRHGIALRTFILVQPPFLPAAEAEHWAARSLDFAFDCGVEVAALIPVRGGNGAMEALASRGEFSPPRLATLEAALDYGIGLRHGRVFADLWDLERFADCPKCFPERSERLRTINLTQQPQTHVACARCSPV